MDNELLVLVLAGTLWGWFLGSFLNTAISRLPRRLVLDEQMALIEALHARGHQGLEDLTGGPTAQSSRFALDHPFPCPHGQQTFRWWHHITLPSWSWRKEECSSCGFRMGWRYPLIEILSAAWLAMCCLRWGVSPQVLAIGGAGLAMLALAAIDAEHLLLPDVITQPLMWAGLLSASMEWHSVSLPDAVWGATLGYVLMAGSAWLFLQLTGKEGLGGGDFKLFAALGAWHGWMALPYLLLIACVTSLLWVAFLRMKGSWNAGTYPFGPWLVLASWIFWLCPGQ